MSVENNYIGLIAGNGILPIEFLKSAKKLNLKTFVIAHQGETSPAIKEFADELHWIKLGQFGRVLKLLKNSKVKKLSFAGGIAKSSVFSYRPDLKALSILLKLKTLNDDLLLREIIREIENLGISVIAPTDLLPDLKPVKGQLTQRGLTEHEQADADLAINVARTIGSLDIGQTVLARDKMILAVEAIEGTDAAIERAGKLASGKLLGSGIVMVKLCKPQQDLRIDLPTIGLATIDKLQSVGGSALVVEADKSIILEPAKVIASADKYNIAIIAI